MIETQSNLAAAASSGAASMPVAGGAQGAGPPAVAVSVTDVLVTALESGAVTGLLDLGQAVAVSVSRPGRARSTAGYAVLDESALAPKTTARKSSTSKSSATKTSTSSGSSAKTSGPLGFLADPKLSVEEKLFKFMCYVADKYDKAIEKKLNEIAGKQSGSSSSGSKSGGGGGALGGLLGGGGGAGGLLGGLLGGGGGGGVLGGLVGGSGGLGGMLGGVFPAAGIALDVLGDPAVQQAVTQLSGPVLACGACCLGFPELAPALLKAGPELTQGAFGLLGTASGGGTGTSSASGAKAASGSGSSSSSSTNGEPQIEQKDMLELQRLQDKQKEMFSLVSNMLRSMHDTKMAVINNLRT
jgi:hypothetical protein